MDFRPYPTASPARHPDNAAIAEEVDEATPVLAHLRLGSVAVVTDPLDTVADARDRLDASTIASPLEMAKRQATRLAESPVPAPDSRGR